MKASRICSVDNCGIGGKLTRGMCMKHYRSWLDHTPPDRREPAPRFARTFDQFVDRTGDCWIWTGPTNRKGYGYWSAGDQSGLAHRISLARIAPPQDESLFACHHCDNPPCVNPAHLYWGTAADNARDVVERHGVVNQNSVKTHCKNNHPLSGDNLRIAGKDRRRQCRICDNERSRAKMAARRHKERSHA